MLSAMTKCVPATDINGRRPIPVSVHGGTVRRGLARLILKQASDQPPDGAADTKLMELPTTSPQPDFSSRAARAYEPVEIGPVATLEPEVQHERQHRDEQERATEIERQQELLAELELSVASGEYERSLQLTSGIDLELAGVSGQAYEQAQDVLFYRMVALCEHAKSYEFNTSSHRRAIEEAFMHSKGFVEQFPDRRAEARAYLDNLQQEVYLNFWHRLAEQAVLEVGIKFLGVHAETAQEAAAMVTQKMIASRAHRIRDSGLQGAQDVDLSEDMMIRGKSLMASTVDGFRFIMLLKGKAVMPLNDGFWQFSKMSGQNCLNTCLRQALIWFDGGEYVR